MTAAPPPFQNQNTDRPRLQQEAMRSAEKAGTEDCPVKMKLLAPPLYVLTTQTLEKNKGVDALTAACDVCKKAIEGRKGRLVIKEAARAVSERDDRLLNDQVMLLFFYTREAHHLGTCRVLSVHTDSSAGGTLLLAAHRCVQRNTCAREWGVARKRLACEELQNGSCLHPDTAVGCSERIFPAK